MKTTLIGAMVLLSSATLKAQLSDDLWKPVAEQEITVSGKRNIIPQKYKTYHLDLVNLKKTLKNVPLDKDIQVDHSSIVLSLPMPDGSLQKFKISESPVMDEALQFSYPSIKTYNVRGIDDRYASGKLDLTEFGFHGMIRGSHGDVFIDPYCQWNTNDYITYYTHDFTKPEKDRLPEIGVIDQANHAAAKTLATTALCAGPNLRTYRLAIACTPEYAAASTGSSTPTTAQVLAKVVTSVNRVDGVYETEVAVKMVLVSTTTLVLFTSAATSSFTSSENSNANSLISKSQTVIDAGIGSTFYDIGHTFSTGGGGLAFLGCVCNANKASGITGSPNPVGDPYDIDYVAHEMGHQFSGNHTFRANTGSCGGNGNLNTAMEPGSGVTIMAYAGICGSSDNVAGNSIAYFHAVSYDEIMDFTTNGAGNSCAVLTSSGNSAPTVVGSANYIIPANTPFELTGSATDPDGDALSYQWEEMDAGTSFGTWNTGARPFFRSYIPSTSTSRMFPKIATVLTGSMQTTIGEYLPTTAQTLQFRFNVRDNKMGGGGVCSATSTITVNASGPFSVTSQSVTGIVYGNASTQFVTWNVNGTNTTPINCINVNIYISTNNGTTFTLIAANTPNDGSESVSLPTVSVTSTACRFKVESVGNVFFDINDKAFTIALATGLEQYANSEGLALQIYPNPFNGSVKVDIKSAPQLSDVPAAIHIYDVLGNLVRSESITLAEHFTQTYDFSALANGTYILEVTDGKQKSVTRLIKM